eukprot:15447269-Alexandrium_andersonii.AAC.1
MGVGVVSQACWMPPRLASRTCESEPPGCESEHSGPAAAEVASDLRAERPFYSFVLASWACGSKSLAVCDLRVDILSA